MKLRTRGGYFWVDARYWDPTSARRVRVQKSTGVQDDGTKSARRTAEVIAEDIWRTIALTKSRGATHTVKQALEANLAQKRLANRSSSTLRIVAEKRRQLESFFGSDTDLSTIDEVRFRDYATQARAAGRAPATVLRELREMALGMKALGILPPPIPDLGRVHTPRERWLTPQETRKLLAEVAPSRREHVLAYRLLGVRKAELFAISARDVDVARWVVRIRGTKTARALRWVPVHSDLRPILLRRMEESPSQLFELWGRGNADRDLRSAAVRAGLGPISFNDLRRSFTMELLRAGVPTRDVAELLGHTSTRMVEAHYAALRSGTHLQTSVNSLSSYDHETAELPTEVMPSRRPVAPAE